MNTKKDHAKKIPLAEYLEKSLSAYNLKNIPTESGTTKYKLTLMLKKPETMTAEVVKVISSMLNTSPLELIEQYNCGLDEITAREYRALATKEKEPQKAK